MEEDSEFIWFLKVLGYGIVGVTLILALFSISVK